MKSLLEASKYLLYFLDEHSQKHDPSHEAMCIYQK
eukprot:14195.XXX_513511_513615_1 [CDS] Oithona nana genome sequencing.